VIQEQPIADIGTTVKYVFLISILGLSVSNLSHFLMKIYHNITFQDIHLYINILDIVMLGFSTSLNITPFRIAQNAFIYCFIVLVFFASI